jgi:peptidoglycan/LPS O-acetylase OafA/YrhL
VTFFFCLSGFIFYWLYAPKVREKTVGPATFTVLRMSRLYPLHFATLVFCAVLQVVHVGWLGRPFVYEYNDAGHFALNLFLIQYWGFESGYSFNGPSWSISVEIFLYIAFFLVCRWTRPGIWQCLVLAAAAVLLSRFSILATAAVTFFLGGASFYIYCSLSTRWTPLKNLVLVAVVVALWALIPSFVEPDALAGNLARLRASLGEGMGDIIAAGAREFAQRQFEFVLFPATVVTLALSETAWKRLPWRRLHDLGNMSYSIYLLHFPLIFAFVSVALAFSFPADFFTRTSTLLVFVALLLAAAAISYRFFEKPTMDALRRMWFRREARRVMAAPGPAAD